MNAATGEPLFPRRLHHETPGWVKSGAFFHVRIRVATAQKRPLTDLGLAPNIIAAAQAYHNRQRWHCGLILLMPDHLHALLAFPADAGMARTIGAWKAYLKRTLDVEWQVNFFDHRIRDQTEFAETWDYILRNPLVKNLCATESAWPWTWRA